MELKQYAYLLWRWMWLIVLVTVLAAAAAYVTSRLTTPVYEASTRLLIDEAPDSDTSDYTAILMSERLARTYAEMITNDVVLEETIQRLGMDMSPAALKGSTNVQLVRDTQLIEVTVEHVNPFAASDLANTLFEVFDEQNSELRKERFGPSKENLSKQLDEMDGTIQSLQASIEDLGSPTTEAGRTELSQLKTELVQYQDSYTRLLQTYEGLRLAEAQTASNIVQIEPAKPRAAPIRPRTMMNTLLAAVVGAMLAVGGVFLIDYLDDTIKTTDEASQRFDLPVIGFITRMGENHVGLPVTISEPRSPTSEAFRSLRSNIQFAGVDFPIQTLLVTSPNPQVGKSTVATNLGVVVAQSGKQVLLIDADMRRPHIHNLMGLPNHIGLSDVFIRPSSELAGIIQRWQDGNLYVLTSGKAPPNPAELLASEKMIQFLETAVKKNNLVIIDSPPIGVVTDPVVLSARVDATLLVVEPGKTEIGATEYAVEQLRRAGANLIGLVFNNVPTRRAGYYTGHYYYYSEYYSNGKDGKGPSNGKKRERKRKEKKEAKG
jgi:succinoglycan biosynthesis transport protein ExoP